MMMHAMGGGFWLFFVLLPLIVLSLRDEFDFRSSRRTARRDKGQYLEDLPREADVYRLARRHGGRITVSDLIADSGVNAATAESTLERVVDGVRVRMEVTDHGVVVYEFHEFIQR